MTGLTPRQILDALDEGLEETELLVALGYDATQGRPARQLLNDLLERRGYGRPIIERTIDRLRPYQPYPEEWIADIARAVLGRTDVSTADIVAEIRRHLVSQTASAS